ncbi:PAS domain-containing protein [Rhizobium sp. PP-CC-3A-592]|nr:PAS domain-containing protein [Rhizobium sp. PP-CC-3A-592]
MPTTSLLGDDATGAAFGQETRGHRLSGISSRHFLKLLEDQGRVGFWSIDFDIGQINGSVGLFRLLGLLPFTRLEFADVIRMIHPADRGANADMMAIIRSGQAIEREFRIIRPDKTLRWIQNRAEALVDPDGVPTRALGMLTDVTEQHEARILAGEGWQSYQRLISAIAEVKWRILPNGKILSLLRWEDLTGQTLEAADNWGWLEAIHPDERDGIRALWAECTRTGQPYSIDLRIRCLAGGFRRYLMRGAPLCNADGSVREWIGVLIETAPLTSTVSAPPVDAVKALDGAHIRAARALLDWNVEDLSLKAGVSVSTIRRLEHGTGNRTRLPHVEAIRNALQEGGVRFGLGKDAEIAVSLCHRPD